MAVWREEKPVPVHRVLTPILLEHVPTDTTRNPEKINQSETFNGFHSSYRNYWIRPLFSINFIIPNYLLMMSNWKALAGKQDFTQESPSDLCTEGHMTLTAPLPLFFPPFYLG